MKCNQCGSNEAVQLLNTILCVKKECQNYDEKWAIEQGYIELEDIDLPSDPNSFRISTGQFDVIATSLWGSCATNSNVVYTGTLPSWLSGAYIDTITTTNSTNYTVTVYYQ